jgi:hypothetical protein
MMIARGLELSLSRVERRRAPWRRRDASSRPSPRAPSLLSLNLSRLLATTTTRSPPSPCNRLLLPTRPEGAQARASRQREESPLPCTSSDKRASRPPGPSKPCRRAARMRPAQPRQEEAALLAARALRWSRQAQAGLALSAGALDCQCRSTAPVATRPRCSASWARPRTTTAAAAAARRRTGRSRPSPRRRRQRQQQQ